LLDLYSVVNDQVHEFVEPLEDHQLGTALSHVDFTYSNSALNSDRQLLVEPYLNRRMLLKKLEDEINRWQKDFAPTASTSSVHDDLFWSRVVDCVE
jgi:hypothetical protein